MNLDLEISGEYGAPGILIFQDLRDSKRAIYSIGRYLEKNFRVFSIYLPPLLDWLHPKFWDSIQKEAQAKILPILETRNALVGIAGGFTFLFWLSLIGRNDKSFMKFYLIEPEGMYKDWTEMARDFWNPFHKENPYSLPELAILPWVMHQISQNCKSIQSNSLPYSIHFLRINSPYAQWYNTTHQLQKKFPSDKLEWSRLDGEDYFTIKFSTILKRFLLNHIAKDFGVKEEKVLDKIHNL